MLRERASEFICPVSGKPLSLRVFAEEAVKDPSTGKEFSRVRSGVLVNEESKFWYPVENFVAVMLTFKTTFHVKFQERHAKEFEALKEYSFPQLTPFPGEDAIQSSFTDQWNLVHESDLSFSYNREDWLRLNRDVWLREVCKRQSEIKRILEIGCGIGAETLAIQDCLSAPLIFGVDLNFSILQAGPRYKERPDIQFVMASLYRLPFAKASFDLVYSQGVIHHTHSTREAFDSVVDYTKPNGFCFIWVYGLDDHLVLRGAAGFVNRIVTGFQYVSLPLLSRLGGPLRDLVFSTMTLLCHPLVKSRMRRRTSWKMRNTNHLLRDSFSVRYRHRHSYNELFEWFEDKNFRIVDLPSATAFRRIFNKRAFGVGATGQRNAVLS
jgi:SAM-dependent methyltransferase